MAVTSPGPVAELLACLRVTLKHWVLLVPAFVMCLLFIVPAFMIFGPGLLAALFSGTRAYETFVAYSWPSIPPSILSGIALAAAILVGFGPIVMAATYAGADDALNGRPIVPPALLRRGGERFLQILAYFAVLMVVGLIVDLVVGGLTALLSSLLGFTPMLLWCGAVIVVNFFLLYAIAAIVVGGKHAGESISQSIELVLDQFGPSVAASIGIAVAGLCSWGLCVVLAYIPVFGILAALAVNALLGVFTAIVITRFYQLYAPGLDEAPISSTSARAEQPLPPTSRAS